MLIFNKKNKKISMKISKKIKLLLFVLSIAFVTMISSCKKGYLDVTNPNVYETDNYPASIDDLDKELYGLYGRLRGGFYRAENYRFLALCRDHSADVAYQQGDFTAAALLSYNSGEQSVGELWDIHYENIAKCVATISDVARFKLKNPALKPNEIKAIDLIEGQALFLRAWNYMVLINYFGETMITSEADKAKLGIPIIAKLATSIPETQVSRNTIGEVWAYIIDDLKKAELLLGTTTWGGSEIARVSGWGVKGLLGKAYVFTQQWPLATAKLKEVIDGSGKSLVSFDTYKQMFNGKFEFNNESLVELNFVYDPNDQPYNAELNTGQHLSLYLGTAYIDNNGRTKNGYANFSVHEKNLSRFGFTGTATSDDDLADPAYLAASATARDTKAVDPRLWLNAFQPYLDSITFDNTAFPTAKILGDGGADLDNVQSWGFRKYILIDKKIDGDFNVSNGNNMYLLRLADVYLLYAEALIKAGANAQALEYINKVHRRAYNQANVNAPGVYDYASLSAATKSPDAVLKNDPLKYERWAELFGEGHWWFDVARWKLGSSEAAYYQKVAVGNLTFQNSKYALPIPIREMNANTKMVQNPGY
jgi:starch-binding outer membrane protein, SusD/RagB family